MNGLLAISCRADLGRFRDNDGTSLATGYDSNFEVKWFSSWFSYENKNMAVRYAKEKGYPYILFMDDDMVIPPNFIERLLKNNVDIVSCNLVGRFQPYEPYVYETGELDGRVHKTVLGQNRGLKEVFAIGMGGVLIKTEVFDKISEPWFEVDSLLKTEDIHISKKFRDAGIKIHYDYETMAGHIVLGALWPTWSESKQEWVTNIVINNQPLVSIPSAKRMPDGTIGIRSN